MFKLKWLFRTGNNGEETGPPPRTFSRPIANARPSSTTTARAERVIGNAVGTLDVAEPNSSISPTLSALGCELPSTTTTSAPTVVPVVSRLPPARPGVLVGDSTSITSHAVCYGSVGVSAEGSQTVVGRPSFQSRAIEPDLSKTVRIQYSDQSGSSSTPRSRVPVTLTQSPYVPVTLTQSPRVPVTLTHSAVTKSLKPLTTEGSTKFCENPRTGPITRIVPYEISERSMTTTPSQAKPREHHGRTEPLPAAAAAQTANREASHSSRRSRSNDSSGKVPITVVHSPRRFHLNRHRLGLEEDESLDEVDNCDPGHETDDSADEEGTDGSENEELEEPPTLDLRGLTVREALAAVPAFLQDQDQKYIESDFDDDLRFVYIITGWGKHSVDHVPKLKPAVEELMNSERYQLYYQYTWSNDGEMEVDLIGRKEEHELRVRALERRKQREKERKDKGV